MNCCLPALGEMEKALRRARRVLIASDFDGTLCPIASTPSEVRVAPSMLAILRSLSSSEPVTLTVISGRALSELVPRLPLPIIFGGNHGLEIRGRGLDFEHPAALARRKEVAAACEALNGIVDGWPGVWVEDKGLSATVHYRNVECLQHRRLRFAVRRCLSPLVSRFSIRAGKKALEVVPKVAWDKGFALNYIRGHTGPFDACICIGDDRTDEMMFRANPDGLNIRIGCARPTDATCHLADQQEVEIFLSHVLDAVMVSPSSRPAL